MNCRCRGRDFGIEEIELVRSLIAEAPARARAELSRLTCLELAWHKADGFLKEMSARAACLKNGP